MPVVPWDNAVDPSEAFDRYGYALAAGDWNGDGHDDLAVGLPGNDYFNGDGFGDLAIGAWARSLGESGAVGAAAVVYGQLFVNGFESRDALEWSAVAP